MTKATLKLFFLIVFITSCFSQLCFAGDEPEHLRIISLSPHITEIIFDLGTGDRVIGTPFADNNKHPDIPVIGDYLNPSIEKIVSLKPNLIIGSRASTRPELIAKLKKLGYHIELVGETSLNDIYGSIISIGKLTNKENNAKNLVTSIKNKISKLEKQIPEGKYKTVFYQIWENPLITAGSDSYITGILELARLNSISANKKGYPRYSIEEVIKENPDVILIPYDNSMKIPQDELIKMWGKYDKLKAVKNNAIYIINANNINSPTPNIVEGYKEIIEKVWKIDTK